MIDIPDTILKLRAGAGAIRALAQGLSDEQALWKPAPDAWSLKDVVEHLYNEERLDFRSHLMEMLSDPPQPWGAYQQEYLRVDTLRQGLEDFLREREDSLAWLEGLGTPDWRAQSRAAFGPGEEIIVLSAGDVLVSWVAHDYLHIRQLNELLFAWNERQAAPYSVQYAGGW